MMSCLTGVPFQLPLLSALHETGLLGFFALPKILLPKCDALGTYLCMIMIIIL